MYRILLVDDEANVLSALRRVLTTIPVDDLDGERPEIETYTSVLEALKRVSTTPIDLIISDYRMPELSGVDFLAQVIERQPEVARLILSAYADLDAMTGAINRVQVFRFISKPWHEFELKSAVTQALAQRALLIENRRLADLVREQHSQLSRHEAELRRLEAESPGITRLKVAPDGGIILDEEDGEDAWT
ncbi:MAG TPA: response regulator [Rudaea sp.]|jgi:response regulator RpfG family c-di-GMP phosphodiesterase|nr:response regulator [Rudaea sp.]